MGAESPVGRVDASIHSFEGDGSVVTNRKFGVYAARGYVD